jgi:hypothetical protein
MVRQIPWSGQLNLHASRFCGEAVLLAIGAQWRLWEQGHRNRARGSGEPMPEHSKRRPTLIHFSLEIYERTWPTGSMGKATSGSPDSSGLPRQGDRLRACRTDGNRAFSEATVVRGWELRGAAAGSEVGTGARRGDQRHWLPSGEFLKVLQPNFSDVIR